MRKMLYIGRYLIALVFINVLYSIHCCAQSTFKWEPIQKGYVVFEPFWMLEFQKELYISAVNIGGESDPDRKAQIAHFDGRIFHILQDDIIGYKGYSYSATVYKNELYIAKGKYDAGQGQDPFRRVGILRYNGKQWTKYAEVENETVIFSMCFFNDTLHLVFPKKGSKDVPYKGSDVYKKSDTGWVCLNVVDTQSTNNGYGISQIKNIQDRLIAIGAFNEIDNENNRLKEVIEWDGKKWKGYANGVNIIPLDIIQYKNNLYLSGGDYLATTNQIPFRKVNTWNSQLDQWLQVGSSEMSAIYKMEIIHDELYGCGKGAANSFSNVSGLVSKYLAPGLWQTLNNQLILGGNVTTMKFYRGYLYIGGRFQNIDGSTEFELANSARLRFDIPPGNAYPIAQNDSYTFKTNDSLHILRVQANDSDPDDEVLYTALLQQPKYGYAQSVTADSIAYYPHPAFKGKDTLVYELCDQDGACDTASVWITIQNPVAPPVAIDDEYRALKNSLYNYFDVQGNDYDPAGYPVKTAKVKAPAIGYANVVNDDSILYRPIKNEYGQDTILYSLCNSRGLCDTAAVYITIEKEEGPVDGVLNGGSSPILIYPNPTEGIMVIEGAEGSWFELFDCRGNVVLSARLTHEAHPVDLSTFPQGLYLYRVLTSQQRSLTGKIMKL